MSDDGRQGEGLPFSVEFPQLYGCLTSAAKWTAFYAVVVPLAILFPVIMSGFAIGFVSAAVLCAWEIGKRKASPTPGPHHPPEGE